MESCCGPQEQVGVDETVQKLSFQGDNTNGIFEVSECIWREWKLIVGY